MSDPTYCFIGWLLIGAMYITGFWTLFQPEMIFGKVGDWLWLRLPEWISKPLYACPPCMSSGWGTAIFLAFGGNSVKLWLLYVVSLCGVMKLITLLFLNKEPTPSDDRISQPASHD